MYPVVRIATEQDWDAIAQLNHDTYALELGQYVPNEMGRKVDGRHDSNIYIVAYMGEELAGMLSITLPSAAPFSTLQRLPIVSEDIRQHLPQTAEIRLLAVKPTFRGHGIFNHLMLTAVQFCYQHGIERVLISAIENRVPLYGHMGFQPIGEAVMEGTAVYLPMLITRQSLESSPFAQKLARMAGAPEAAK
ncbi:MAG: GNAT family N-acetyltransferase [Anaerolineae bacterium]|nr:GNAT family N-acetyltransferase [Anaerolineae bacterium]